ncbi:S8 family serine peptidase [Alkalicoccus urumqiensis]|uniref:Lactocepin n=1 Tax=Alkalicoccus urumqiensis TaxID=1548213 RepID=A0A2P6MHQ4_ALKUR|nr:S8 family serine peptidase [Alkalicoccus urumqiensis]PRO65824.1 lactocepin [Alkalicoccus urumqiensis]
MRQVKRTLTAALAVPLLVTGALPGAVSAQPDQEAQGLAEVEKKMEEKEANLNRVLRVIVELEEPPAMERAAQRGNAFGAMNKNSQRSLKEEVSRGQQIAKQAIANRGIEPAYIKEFTTVANGFSAEVTEAEAEALKHVEGVARVTEAQVYERPEVTPDTNFGSETIEAIQTREQYETDGEGMVIGVIDSGIYDEHPDMQLTNPENAALSAEDITEAGLDGEYRTAKIPYVYNYIDEETPYEVFDTGNDHGMHVAGTAAANGDPEAGGVRGVAPEAQILGMKVFSNDPENATTTGDIYIAALDDAIELGADVINMSLGAPAGNVDDESPEQQAVARAKDNGVFVSISAGNSNRYGSGWNDPLTDNPDIGVVGAPSVSEASLSVASSENTQFESPVFRAEAAGSEAFLSYGSFSDADPEDVIGDTALEVVDAGLGSVEEFDAVDAEGKIALIERGEYAFVDKTLNAQQAGAEASIIYNNEAGLVSMQGDPDIEIPHLAVSQSSGEELLSLMEEDTLTIAFGEEPQIVDNPFANNMSDFTSWGLTPQLEFKPEVTAPGGQIYSTLGDDDYGLMSGTSMAAPHAAGGAALLLDRVDSEFDVSDFDRVQLAQTLMLNTAEPKIDSSDTNQWDAYYSPRRQGAGELNLFSAYSTPVTVVETTTDEGKVELKEMNGTASFTLELTNHSDEARTYDVNGTLQGMQVNGPVQTDDASPLENAVLTTDEEVTVDADATTTVEVEIDVSQAEVFDRAAGDFVPAAEAFENGYFVDGFIEFADPADEVPSLSVPLSGFEGGWDDAPNVDPAPYEAGSYYGQIGMNTGIMTVSDGELGDYLGFNGLTGQYEEQAVAFSPERYSVVPDIAFLRNVSDLEIVVQEDGEDVVTLFDNEGEFYKNYFDGGLGLPSTLIAEAMWDGTVGDEVLEDGDYTMDIRSTLAYDGAEEQSYDMPFTIDTVAPVVSLDASAGDDVISWEITEEGSGVYYQEVTINDEELLLAPGVTELELDQALQEGDDVQVSAVDFAENTGSQQAVIAVPTITIDSPEAMQVFNESDVALSGSVTEVTQEAVVTADEQRLQLDASLRFDTVLEDVNDGFHETVVQVEKNGLSAEERVVYAVDTQAPELAVSGAPERVMPGVEDVTLEIGLEDNLNGGTLSINGDVVFSQELDFAAEETSLSTRLVEEVELNRGRTDLLLEFTDAAGNTVSEEITIRRGNSNPGGGRPIDPPGRGR